MPGLEEIQTVGPDDLEIASSTPNILRELAFDTDRAMLVRANVEGNVASGWHHHGDREVLGFLVRGQARMDYGPGGKESTEVEEGGFLHVPAGLVHRDVNPVDEPQEWVLAFIGSGPLVENLDGPDPG